MDRVVSLYGYVRGTFLKPNQSVHLIGTSLERAVRGHSTLNRAAAGVGDFSLEELTILPDPCPCPGTESKKR
jgi:ribosome biogenesis protein BMS1